MNNMEEVKREVVDLNTTTEEDNKKEEKKE